MLALGIPLGLTAAVAQSLSYLVSRGFVLRHPAGSLRLLALAHGWMGLAAALCLPLVWLSPAAGWSATLLPLGCGLAGYLGAQAWFFFTVRRAPASRVAPLMGLKIAVLALLVWGLGVAVLGIWHWLGVLLALLAVPCVQLSGPRLGASAWGGLLATIGCFAISDVSIQALILAIDPAGSFAACSFAVALTYSAAAVVGLVLIPVHGRPGRSELAESGRYALCWGGGMVALFGAIGQAGVVLAILLQALRGPITVLLGAWHAWRHREVAHHEQIFERGAILRQLLAALLMVAACVVYALGG